MINKIRPLLEEFDVLILSSEKEDIEDFLEIESSIEDIFNQYSSESNFDPYLNDEFINEEVSKLYNLTLHLNSVSKNEEDLASQNLRAIFLKLSELESNI